MSAALAVLYNGMDAMTRFRPDLAGSRGLHYGDGVFRTMLKYEGRLIDRERQLARLAADAERLGLRPPAASLLHEEIEQAAKNHASATIKILLIRSGTQRGYRSTESGADRLVLLYTAPAYPVEKWTKGIRAFRSPVVMARQPLLAGIKHLNRLEQVLAARDWQDQADEGILCCDEGQPVCGTRSNLFWVDDAGLHTPALDDCGVAGIMRDRVIEAARARGLPVTIAAAHWTCLMDSREAFVTNSLIGIWPLRSLDDRQWNAPGPVTAGLASAVDHPRLIAR